MWRPPPGQAKLPAAPASSSETTRNVLVPRVGSVIVTGSAWCETFTVGSKMLLRIVGLAGLVVLRIVVCEIAAVYARVPVVLNVTSCESLPRPGKIGMGRFLTKTGLLMSLISKISMEGLMSVARSELELYRKLPLGCTVWLCEPLLMGTNAIVLGLRGSVISAMNVPKLLWPVPQSPSARAS